MSFVTKRERVFEPDLLVELPARSDGKIKDYSSCTDTRAWSHHSADQTEHLMENIKRNTSICRPKYLSTEVIVRTLMTSKNKDIARLKRKISQLEEMLNAYDSLDLSCAQKCEIAKAHESIKACYQDLNDMSLDLDLSGFTEGVDSEAYETGKSGGDSTDRSCCTRSADSRKRRSEVKFSNIGDSSLSSCKCDKATNAVDKSCAELQQVIKQKDAKLKSLQNAIKVMENDSCEPYCIYAHIYTALEKIFCVLSQNDKYREYLYLLAKGQKEGTDIKGKIYFKLKVLEKFSAGLISPCTPQYKKDCKCYHLQITSHVETSYGVNTSEIKRAHLAADIMETGEIKEILDKESNFEEEDTEIADDSSVVEEYDANKENLLRLKNLQKNYDELMICYETIKYERDLTQSRYVHYEELEDELENLRSQLREFDDLKLERDECKDGLEELNKQYLFLSEEVSNYERQLRAECEINLIKTNKIADLRDENVALEKKINDLVIRLGKEKNTLQCKVMEMECKIMCQEQQIKSLTEQMDMLVKENNEKPTHDTPDPAGLLTEISLLKKQVNHLREILCSSDEEKKNIEDKLNKSTGIIDELKKEVKNWKESYETVVKQNDKLERRTEDFQKEMERLTTLNKNLTDENTEKAGALENLLNIIKNKSIEMNRLLEEIENKRLENSKLRKDLMNNENRTDPETLFSNAKTDVIDSENLLDKSGNCDAFEYNQEEILKFLNTHCNNDKVKRIYNVLLDKCEQLQRVSDNLETENKMLIQELRRLQELHEVTNNDLRNLEHDKTQYLIKLESALAHTKEMEGQVSAFQILSIKMQKLQDSYEKLLEEKNEQEEFVKRESEEYLINIKESESIKDAINYVCQKLLSGEMVTQTDVNCKSHVIENLMKHIEILQIRKQNFFEKYNATKTELNHLRNKFEILMAEKNELLNEVEDRVIEINKLHNKLQKEVDENKELSDQILKLRFNQNEATIENVFVASKDCAALCNMQNNVTERSNDIDEYERLKTELQEAKTAYSEMEAQKNKFLKRFEEQMYEIKEIRIENQDLYNQKKNLIIQNGNLENELMELRNEILAKAREPEIYCTAIVKEMEQMKNEKLQSLKKKHELLERIDEMDNTISNLSDQLMGRADKIATLENYINALEDEIRKLQRSLTTAVETGEQIHCNNIKYKEKSFQYIEADHSKISQDLKKQIEKLYNENVKVEKQLFALKLQFDELEREKNTQLSEIIHLQNERDIMIVELRQLETKSVGDSSLSPENFSVDDVLSSIKRVMKYIEIKNAKNSSLEQTLMKVQTSSELLLIKADEAKVIIEREKQKMHNEKEEAVKDKVLMARELSVLKAKLENQIDNDKQVIKDLEAELLNHKLIIENITTTTGNENLKFEKEMQYLRNMYKNSVIETKELKETIQTMILEKEKYREILNTSNNLLEQKNEEIDYLKEQLLELRSKRNQRSCVKTQTEPKAPLLNITTQTVIDIREFSSNTSESRININENINVNTSNKEKYSEKKEENSVTLAQIMNNIVTISPRDQLQLVDFLRSCINTKFKNLSTGSLEQYSISSFESINFGDCNNTKEAKNSRLLVKCVNIWKESSGKSKCHSVSKELFHKMPNINVKYVTVKEKHNEIESLEKSESQVSSDLLNSTDEKYNSNEIEGNKLLLMNSQQNDKDILNVHNNNRKYIVESCKQDMSFKGTDANHKHIMKSNYKQKCFNFCDNVQKLNKKFVTCKNISLNEDCNLKCTLSCTAATILDTDSHPPCDEYPSLNDASETKRNSYLYSVHSENNLIVYSDDKVVISDMHSSSLLNTGNPNTVQTKISSVEHGTQSPSDKNHALEMNDTRTDFRIADQSLEKQDCQTKLEVNISHGKNKPKTQASIPVKPDFVENTTNNKYNDYPKVDFDNEYKIDKGIGVGVWEVDSENDIIKLKNELTYIFTSDNKTNLCDDSPNSKKPLVDTMKKMDVLYANEVAMKPTSSEDKARKYRGAVDEFPVKIKSNTSTKTLVATKVVAVEVKPKVRPHDECVCMFNLKTPAAARTTHNIRQEEGEKSMKERVYTTHIARKILSKNIEDLDADELKFLHSKVCQSWKSKIQSEKALLKRLEMLETLKNQGHDQKNVAELQRKVREERRRLQEFRKAIFRSTPVELKMGSPQARDFIAAARILDPSSLVPHFTERGLPYNNAERDISFPMGKEYRSIDDAVIGGLKAKVVTQRASTRWRQLHEDKREAREKKGGTTHDPPMKQRRGLARLPKK